MSKCLPVSPVAPLIQTLKGIMSEHGSVIAHDATPALLTLVKGGMLTPEDNHQMQTEWCSSRIG